MKSSDEKLDESLGARLVTVMVDTIQSLALLGRNLTAAATHPRCLSIAVALSSMAVGLATFWKARSSPACRAPCRRQWGGGGAHCKLV